ncbi:MAG: AAA family ATPase [Candidatus Aenigmatarchaeota archaeon]
MIKKIRLVNWKSHLDSELVFTDGVNALIGIMGSGKTSVMQAIEFALFGTSSKILSKKMKIEDFIMYKPQIQDSAGVELEFEHNGTNYKVKRVIYRGKTTHAELHKNGKLIQTGSDQVTEEIQRILQMDYGLFSRAIYSEQNALDYFLQLSRGDRKREIDKMLKLDMYEKVRENATKIRNLLERRRLDFIKEIEELKKNKLEEKEKNIKKEIKEKETEIERLKRELEVTENRKNQLLKEVEECENEQKSLNNITHEVVSLTSKIGSLEKQIKDNEVKIKGVEVNEKVISELKEKMEEIKNKVEEKVKKINELRDKYSTKNERIRNLSERLEERKKTYEELKEKRENLTIIEKQLGSEPEKEIEKLKMIIKENKETLSSLEAEKKEIIKNLGELEGTKDKCPVCETPLSSEKKSELIKHKKRHIEELENEAKELSKKISVNEEKFQQLSEKLEMAKELKRDLKNFEKIEKEKLEIEEEISNLKREVEEISEKILKEENEEKSLKENFEGIKTNYYKLEMAFEIKKEIMELEKEKEGLKIELHRKKEEKENLEKKLEEKNLKKMQHELQETVGYYRELKTKIEGYEENIIDKRKSLEEIQAQIQRLKRYQRDVIIYEKSIENLDKFIDVLLITQKELRLKFLETINKIMKNIWTKLYPYDDYVEIRMEAEENDYGLKLKSSRGWKNVELLSGGERSIACLALRIAFSFAFMPNLKWLILDEPTHNLDDKAIEQFGTLLRDKMENIIHQVFLITHEQRLSDFIEGSVYLLERDKQLDGVTKVIKRV